MERIKSIGEKFAFPAIAILVLMSCLMPGAKTETEYNTLVPKMYNSAGQITSTACRMSILRVALTTSPQTADISPTGYTTVYAVLPVGENNTTAVAAMPMVTVKSFTTTSAILNTAVSNSTTVSAFGLNVLGLVTPTVFTGMYVNLLVIGN